MSWIVFVICDSVSESRELVASSNIIRSGFLRSDRAIARRWRSPPESLIPPSPIFVSRPLFPLCTICVTCARFKTSRHCLSVAFGFTKRRFSFIVPAKSCVSCETKPIFFLYHRSLFVLRRCCLSLGLRMSACRGLQEVL